MPFSKFLKLSLKNSSFLFVFLKMVLHNFSGHYHKSFEDFDEVLHEILCNQIDCYSAQYPILRPVSKPEQYSVHVEYK